MSAYIGKQSRMKLPRGAVLGAEARWRYPNDIILQQCPRVSTFFLVLRTYNCNEDHEGLNYDTMDHWGLGITGIASVKIKPKPIEFIVVAFAAT